MNFFIPKTETDFKNVYKKLAVEDKLGFTLLMHIRYFVNSDEELKYDREKMLHYLADLMYERYSKSINYNAMLNIMKM